MGICDSCCKGSSSDYSEIPKSEQSNALLGSKKGQSSNESYQKSTELSPHFHTSAGEKEDEKNASEFDMNSSVFEGLEIQQKFTNKSSYDTRFVWVNLHSRTIHMSQYMTKDRRHKEATLADVTAVVAGPPAKGRRVSNGKANENLNESCCLTINFKRGGGIDLIFATKTERDLWFSTLKRIIVQNRNLGSSDE